MHLAINYSPPAVKLVQSGRITIDYFKIPDWVWMVEEARAIRPVAVHFTLEAGNSDLGHVNWEFVKYLAQISTTPYINLHLDSNQESLPGLPLDTTDPSDLKRVYAVLLFDVMSVVERFGSSHIIVENSPYRGEPGNTLRPCVEPELITRIVEETSCGFFSGYFTCLNCYSSYGYES